MPRTPARRLTVFVLIVLATVAAAFALPAGSVSAHNTLISSDPADGAILEAAPVQITWMFDQPVPLDTMTVTLIDATGARSDLAGSAHGASGDTEVITPLPALASGAVSVRWRLVGPDGHPITGRVDFTVEAAVAVTSPATDTTQPAVSASAPPSTSPATDPPPSLDGGDDTFSTPSFLRWLLRYGSYLAIMAAVGILLTPPTCGPEQTPTHCCAGCSAGRCSRPPPWRSCSCWSSHPTSPARRHGHRSVPSMPR